MKIAAQPSAPPSNTPTLTHLAKAAFAENFDEAEVLEAPPLDLSVLPRR